MKKFFHGLSETPNVFFITPRWYQEEKNPYSLYFEESVLDASHLRTHIYLEHSYCSKIKAKLCHSHVVLISNVLLKLLKYWFELHRKCCVMFWWDSTLSNNSTWQNLCNISVCYTVYTDGYKMILYYSMFDHTYQESAVSQ